MMGRPGIVCLDAFQFDSLEHIGLPLHLLFQNLDELCLARHDFVQLFDLMFQMGDMGFNFLEPSGCFIRHGQDFAREHTGSPAGEFSCVELPADLGNNDYVECAVAFP